MEPRYYQSEARDSLYAAILDADTHPVAAIPTGAGKSLVIAELIRVTLEDSPNCRMLILSHTKEILEQNWKEIKEHLGLEVALYSAGLGSRDVGQITIAGIQSVYNKPELFEGTDVVVIDEAHLIPLEENTMYRSFLSALDDVTYVGLTATPFRLGTGYIHEGKDALFNKLVCDYTSKEAFNKLVDEGYLAPLILKSTDHTMDASNVKVTAGDYNVGALADKFDREAVTRQIVDEIVRFGKKYKKWLIFAIDIGHAEHINSELKKHGIASACVHSRMTTPRDEVIQAFKDGEYRALVNVDVLTTGFNVPGVDLIAMARPTKSPVIYLQSLGRGMRTAEGKDHCLVLDFAGNVQRLGPIDNVQVTVKGKGKGGEQITKLCPDCGVIHAPSVRECNACGYQFQFKHGLSPTAATGSVTEPITWVRVDSVSYGLHHKPGKPDSMRVTYHCGLADFNEWICISHDGYAGAKAMNWVRRRYNKPFSRDVYFLLKISPLLKRPSAIRVRRTGKYVSVEGYEFEDLNNAA
jgi:DNA repair protein RadD